MGNLSNKQQNNRTSAAFTLVELLIVIVVIAILAAITVVAYNGISKRAQASVAQEQLSQINHAISSYFVDNNAYPTQLSALNIQNTSSVSYQYSVNNTATPATWCVTATSGTTSYYQNNTDHTIPTPGGCPGHGQNGVAAITNLATNPSFEDGIFGGTYQGAALSNGSPGTVPYGATALEVMPVANTGFTGWDTGNPAGWISGQTYTVSVAIYRTSATETLVYFVDGVGETTINVPVDTWTRISMTFTYTSGSFGVRQDNATASPSPFYLDGVMYTRGPVQYSYADGNSPSWIWNGTPNASTSTGPVL